MKARRWLSQRRTPAPAACPVAPALDRVVPAIEELQVHALDRAAFREGAEAMRTEVLRILNADADPAADGCHPVFHELGTHAPVGNARPVAP